MYWLLFYDVVDDYLDRRAPLRESHLALARASYERGDLLLAGALADPADSAVLAFMADDVSVVEEFARNDPYVEKGLVTGWRIRRWNVVVGDGQGR
jgi:uncharacterized protein YciI